MKSLKTYIPLLFAALMLGISACDDDDFKDLNTNPNQPESVEPNLLLPGVIRRTTNNAVDNSFLSGNIVAQTATKTLRVEDELYILGSLPGLWTTHYDALRDLENIKEQAVESVTINGSLNNGSNTIKLSGATTDELTFNSDEVNVSSPSNPVKHRAVTLGGGDIQILIVPQDVSSGRLELVEPEVLTSGDADAGSATVIVNYDGKEWTSTTEGNINIEANNSGNVRAEINDVVLQSGNTHRNYQGIALVMEAWLFSVLTDAYGDIPYDQALGGDNGEFSPEFTPQEEVYRDPENGLIALLDKANTLLDPSGQSVTGDILYDGDVSKWKRFCNSLKLRLLTHLTSRSDQESFVSQKMSEVVNNPNQYPVFQSSEDNAVLSYLNAFPNEFPLLPLKIGDFDAVNMSKVAVDEMKDLNDPRLQEYARPSNIDQIIDNDTAAVYEGLENGYGASADEKATSGSRLGYRYYDYPDHPQVQEKANGIIMSNAELRFILAEAKTRGWINGGQGAEQYYREGIVSAMTYYGVSLPDTGAVTSISDYYNQADVDFSQASNQQEQLEYIGKQKWLALWFHGLEPFFELRRGLNDQARSNPMLPFLSPAEESSIGNRFPYRFEYPGNAESLNNQEFEKALSSQGENDVTTEIWLVE